MNDLELFAAAIAISDTAVRAALLDRECVGRSDLRNRVDQLLNAHFQSNPLLDQTGPGDLTASHHKTIDAAGTVIAGRYKLLQQIGEGGMGSVWMADQTEPVKRRVAVKLIRAERGQSKTILSRFQAERQAIALMDHPNIAKLLDAGTTDDECPFFVMELVKGVPLTEYCDAQRLSIQDRLQLFMQICSAVQHAHQKGIIHRDLKPTNILVESHDDKPVPKVIDFGLAKATSGLQLTENTLFTGFGTVMGTPLYMAPEQAKFNAVDVDTRADIYALGVILYELLTGTTPLTRDTIKLAALDEMLKLIREQEAPTPSSRLSSSDSKPSIAANRQSEPQKLGRVVRGDLDWIVMKALSKERDRRYESANGFAKDIERFLQHEPVTAGPPSTSYRLRKFVQRNRGQVIAASLVLLALLAGMVGTTWGMLRADRARADEAVQRAIAVEKQLEAEASATAELEQRIKAEKAEAAMLASYRASTDDTIEYLIGSKGELSPSERMYLENSLERWKAFAARAGNDERSQAIRGEGLFRVALLWQKLGQNTEARTGYEQSMAIQEMLVAEFPGVAEYRARLANSHGNLGLLLADLGKSVEAEKQYRQGLALQEKLAAEFSTIPTYRKELAVTQNNLGLLLGSLGKQPAATVEFQKSLAIFVKLAADFPAAPEYSQALAMSHSNVGRLLAEQGKLSAAEEEFRKSLAILEKLATESPAYRQKVATSCINLGALLAELGKRSEAEVQYRKGMAIQEKLAAEFPANPAHRQALAVSHRNIGLLQADMGKQPEAEGQIQKAVAIRERLVAEFPAIQPYQVELGGSYGLLGSVILDGGRPTDGLKWFDQAIRTLAPIHDQDPRRVMVQEYLRNCYAGRARTLDQLLRHSEAVEDWDKAIQLSPQQQQPPLRASRATSRIQAEHVAGAVAEVAELTAPGANATGLANWNADQWYDFACVYAVASGKLTDKQDEYAKRAVELLQQAVKAGWEDASQMKQDANLDPLRDREDFQKLLAELEKEPEKK